MKKSIKNGQRTDFDIEYKHVHCAGQKINFWIVLTPKFCSIWKRHFCSFFYWHPVITFHNSIMIWRLQLCLTFNFLFLESKLIPNIFLLCYLCNCFIQKVFSILLLPFMEAMEAIQPKYKGFLKIRVFTLIVTLSSNILTF